MTSRAIKLAVLCAGLVVLGAPTAEAVGARGCKASCNKGSCNSSNSYAECGCCGDGTPYCGSASNCKDKVASAFTLAFHEVATVGGMEGVFSVADKLKVVLKPTDGSAQLIASVVQLGEAILSGDSTAAQAAQLITIERFEGLEEGDDLVALKVVTESMVSR
ncbi:hypothetical protein [Hyalangium gracile]|uniref:hypothetical protein n=1 Tax=Hyalangium gracile TaxID=394092 RepID=UPI001CCA2EED|nr:hypothetical protein [Hyalangium gracile]